MMIWKGSVGIGDTRGDLGILEGEQGTRERERIPVRYMDFIDMGLDLGRRKSDDGFFGGWEGVMCVL